MSFTFSCNLEQFKRIVADFLKALENPSMSLDELAQGMKCVSLHYIGMNGKGWEEIIAGSYMEFATRRYIEAGG